MANDDGGSKSAQRGTYILAMVNVGIWAISIVALVFVIQRFPGARRMFPILAGGTAVGVALLSVIQKR